MEMKHGRPDAEVAKISQRTQKEDMNIFLNLLRPLRDLCGFCVRLSDPVFASPLHAMRAAQ